MLPGYIVDPIISFDNDFRESVVSASVAHHCEERILSDIFCVSLLSFPRFKLHVILLHNVDV